MCILSRKVGLLQAALLWVLLFVFFFFNPLCHSISFRCDTFSPLAFKVIIDRHVLIVILKLVFPLISYFFLVLFHFVVG